MSLTEPVSEAVAVVVAVLVLTSMITCPMYCKSKPSHFTKWPGSVEHKHTLTKLQLSVNMHAHTHKIDRLCVDVGEGDTCTNSVTQHSTDHHPWGKLQGLRYNLSIQLQVTEVPLATQEAERDITGLEMLGEPARGTVRVSAKTLNLSSCQLTWQVSPQSFS